MSTTISREYTSSQVPSSVAATALRWFRLALGTASDAGPVIARLTLAGILAPHGAQHGLGLLGGYGFSGTLGWMTKTLGFPAPLAAIGIVTELVAPLLLLLGAGGRLAALAVIGLMLGAIRTHVANGFFMNWFAAMPAGSEGFEYHLLVVALAAIVAVKGSGALSLDRRLGARR